MIKSRVETKRVETKRVDVKDEYWEADSQKLVAYRGRIFSASQKMIVYETKYYPTRKAAKQAALKVFSLVAEPAVRVTLDTDVVILRVKEALHYYILGKLSKDITKESIIENQFQNVFKTTKEISYVVRHARKED